MKKLDRPGKGASNDFVNMSDDQVLRYVLFDIHEDTLFAFGNLILSRGRKGVPIGGFLSAQLAEIWCSWKEAMCLFGKERAKVECAVTAALHSSFPDAMVPWPHRELGFHYCTFRVIKYAMHWEDDEIPQDLGG